MRDLLVDIPINALLQRVSLQIALLRGQRVQRQEFARRQIKAPRAGDEIRMYAAVVSVILCRDAQKLTVGHIGLRQTEFARPVTAVQKDRCAVFRIELLGLCGHLRRLGLKPCEHVIHLRVEGVLRRELRGVARAAVRCHVFGQRVELAVLCAQLEHRQFVALRQKHRAVVGLVLVFVDLRRDLKVQRARLRRRVVLRPAGRSCAAGGQIQRQHAAKQQRHPFFHSVLLSRSRFLAQTITGPSVHALLPLAARSSG